jgi:hypothetical protein
LAAAQVVEFMHQNWIALKRLWRGDIFYPVATPEAIGPAKGLQARLGGNACPGKDDDILLWWRHHGLFARSELSY